MISLTKMNKILEYDKENFVVKIQSGVLLNDLAQDAEKQGYYIHQIQVRNSQPSVGNVAKCWWYESSQIWMYKRLCTCHDSRTSNR